MAEEAEKQTVADGTDVDAQQQSTEAQGAQDETLDSLLSEWEQETGSEPDKGSGGETKPTPKNDQKVPDDVGELVQYVRQRQQEEIAEKTDRDIKAAVDAIREGWDQAPHERLLRGELYRAASEDSRFMEAFQRRHQNPERWQRTLRAIQRELQSELGGNVDQQATNDRDVVTAAVRSASKAPPPKGGPSEQEIANMSDAEFERFRRGL